MIIEYSISAKNKLINIEFSEYKEFFQVISEKKLNTAIMGLPKEKSGFRPGKDTEIRIQKYFARLKKDKSESWSVFLEVWFVYTDSNTVIRNLLGAKNRNDLNKLVGKMLQSVDVYKDTIEKIVTRSYENNLSRETIQKWLLFSPFEYCKEVEILLSHASSDKLIYLKEEIKILDKKMTVIEDNLNSVEVIENGIREAFDIRFKSYENDMHILKQKIGQLETKNRNIHLSVDHFNKEIESHRENIRKEVSEIQKTTIGNINKAKQLKDEIEGLTSYVENLVSELDSLKMIAASNEGADSCVPGSPPIIIELNNYESQEIEELDSSKEVISVLRKNISNLGVKLPQAKKLAMEIYAGLAAGQLVMFEGSLSNIIAERCAISLTGGRYALLKIPFGLLNSEEFKRGLENVIKNHANNNRMMSIIIEGINKSEFEYYGGFLKEIIVKRVMRLIKDYDSIFIFATMTEGTTSLSAGKETIELGPIFYTDSLSWLSRKPKEAVLGNVSMSSWVEEIDNVEIDREREEEELIIPEGLLIKAGALWSKNVLLADTIGRKMNTSDNSYCEFCLFGWIIPMALHYNINIIDHYQDHIDNDDRLRRLIIRMNTGSEVYDLK